MSQLYSVNKRSEKKEEEVNCQLHSIQSRTKKNEYKEKGQLEQLHWIQTSTSRCDDVNLIEDCARNSAPACSCALPH
jgi:hypothetical protein